MTTLAHTEQTEQTTAKNDDTLTTTTKMFAADAAVIAAENAHNVAYRLAAANRKLRNTHMRNLPPSDPGYTADQQVDSIADAAAEVRRQIEVFTEAADAAVAAAERVTS